MSNPQVLAVISARGGSKGVPKKNVRLLGGKPLVSYMLSKAKACSLITQVVCSTDDEVVAEIAKGMGVEVPFMRPAHLSGDQTPLISVTQFMMLEMDKLGFAADIVVQLAPTCPFVKTVRLEESVKMVMDSDCECAVSLKRIEHEHPYRARKLSENNYFENFIQNINVEALHSRQELPELWCTTGGLYTRQRHLLDTYDGKDFALGKKRKGILLDDIEALNIDRLIDFQFAEFLIGSGYLQKDHLQA
jgi:CMP-N-acetylneuraminic acid synthetase